MKYYCHDQFKTLHIRSTNTGQVLVSPCCAAQTEAVVPEEFDFAANAFLTQTRDHTVANTAAPACSNCWRQEAQNLPSRRSQGRAQDISVQLNRIDVTVQNVCNLACVMCSSYSSSLWAKQDGVIDQDYSFEDKLKLFKRLDFSHVYQIHFTGGEPLMTTEHLRMMKIYAEQASLDQLHISYNTNGTFFPDKRVLEVWSQVKAIDLVISLDAVGEACELIRWPAVWSDIADNVAKFYELKKTMPHIKIGFICCASNYNLLEMPEIMNFCHAHDPEVVVHFQANHRPYFAPNMIPPEMVDHVNRALASYADAADLLHSVNNPPAQDIFQRHWHTMTTYMDELDTRRGTNWRQALKIGQFA
jgi:sulfatase maturation enzyme AslB (radical SAM superfamily)